MIPAKTIDESDDHRQGEYVHATAVAVAETGILIRGASGAGKSRLALTLIFMAESAGCFARLVGDDRIRLESAGSRLVARGHPSIQGAIECRGRGILRAAYLDAVVLGLVVDLVASNEAELSRCPDDQEREVVISRVKIPKITIHSALGPTDQASRVLLHFRVRQIIF